MGTALSGAIHNYQQQKMTGQQYKQGQLDLMQRRMMMQGALQQFGGPQGAAPPAAGAPTPAGAPQAPAAPQPPQGAPAAPAWLTPPSMSGIYSAPVGGFSPNYLKMLAAFSKDPLTETGQLRTQQLQQAQQALGPTIGRLDTILKSGKPSETMQADPEFKGDWPQAAQLAGRDPADLSDDNVGYVLAMHRNNLASSLSQPTSAPPIQDRLGAGPAGFGQQILTSGPEHKVTQLNAPSYPSVSLQEGQTTGGQKYYTPVQTSGYRAPGSGVGVKPTNQPKGTGEVPAGATATGFAPTTPDNVKQAGYAVTMDSGLRAVRGLENKGFVLGPVQRAALFRSRLKKTSATYTSSVIRWP